MRKLVNEGVGGLITIPWMLCRSTTSLSRGPSKRLGSSSKRWSAGNRVSKCAMTWTTVRHRRSVRSYYGSPQTESFIVQWASPS